MKNILIIDSGSESAYTIQQMVKMCGFDSEMCEAEKLKELDLSKYSHIIIADAVLRKEISEFIAKSTRDRMILAVNGAMLGMAETFGCKIFNTAKPEYAVREKIHIANGSPVFKGLPPMINGGLYTAKTVYRDELPEEVLVIAEDDSDKIMGIKHRDFDFFGLQFNVESVLTDDGLTIIGNFLEI